MKMRSLAILLALAAALFAAVACGGGDNTTTGSATTGSATPTNKVSGTVVDQALKDYFQQLSTILTGVDAQMQQLNNQYPSAGLDPDQTRQLLAQFLPTFNTALSGIKSLNPPSTAKDLHDRLVSSLEDLLTAENSLSNDVQSINSATDMKAYFDSHKTEFNAKTDLVNSICSDLQAQANSKSLGVDLKCSGAASSTAPSPASTAGPAGSPP